MADLNLLKRVASLAEDLCQDQQLGCHCPNGIVGPLRDALEEAGYIGKPWLHRNSEASLSTDSPTASVTPMIDLPNNCPIKEQTGDGVIVGRCFYYLQNGTTCPRHGDVSKEIENFRATGELTLESDFRAKTKESKS